MRNISKVLLLAVVLFVAYLLWPRSANLKNFDPQKLAQLQVRNWKSIKEGKGFDAMMARYWIYASEYHFPPITAMHIAQNQGTALFHLKGTTDPDNGANEETRAVQVLTEKYGMIKDATKSDFDPDALAHEELTWRTLEMQGAPVDQVAAPLSQIFAALYGGKAEDFTEAATGLVNARAIILKDSSPESVVAARSAAKDADELLKQIAATPPAAPAP